MLVRDFLIEVKVHVERGAERVSATLHLERGHNLS
jgi:hypothetical protein